MNTPAHLIAASALLARRDAPVRNRWIVAGALLPDLWIYGFFVWAAAVQGLLGETIWQDTYWTEPWQTIGAIFNAMSLAGLIIVGGFALKKTWLTVFGLAMALHILLDFPLHADDAHRHFWPITDWRFISPVSYWDPSANGRWGILVEFSVVAAGSFFLWRRFPSLWLRCLVALATAISMVMVTLYWFSPPGFGT